MLDASITSALIAAVVVLLGLATQTWLGWSVFQQKIEHDHRDQQWKRIQWAVDLSLQPGDRQQEISSATLDFLATKTYVDPSDYLVIETALLSQQREIDESIEEAMAVLLQERSPDGDEGARPGPGQDGTGA